MKVVIDENVRLTKVNQNFNAALNRLIIINI